MSRVSRYSAAPCRLRPMTQVEMQCGPFAVVSLMSTEAARELTLQPASVAVAVVRVAMTGGSYSRTVC
ncbi:hypothetical protein [Mycobacterium lacus]|uniref:hypothetical protein n=1 Tax=Mycobacterium lacus TaxID=169765 RepID=UPI000A15AF7B|nr:hypothetical protein [Mycobacterium lacus]